MSIIKRNVSRRSAPLSGATLSAGSATADLSNGDSSFSSGKPKRVFFAMLFHETNTFSPVASDMDMFQANMVSAGQLREIPEPTRESIVSGLSAPLYFARKNSSQYNWIPFQGMFALGAPGGVVPKEVYEKLRDQFIADLKAVMPIDIVALMLHGAMVAEGYENCEADLLKHVREVVGDDAIIGAVFDSHAHLGSDLIKYGDILIATKEYPHIDFGDRSKELVDLLHATSHGNIKPVSSSFDCRMIDIYHTPREPMRSFVDKLQNIERDDEEVLSISVFHSFPWGDTPVMGTKILVITDNNPQKGEQLAEQLGKELFSMRGKLAEKGAPMDQALDQAMAISGGPIVLADAADNPGGGAPCDSTFILQSLLNRGINNVVFGRINDPEATKQAIAAGEGALLRLKVGGKLSSQSGQPIDQNVMVKKILRANDQGVNGEEAADFDAVWIEVKGIDVIVSDISPQVFVPAELSRFGIPLKERKLIVVKSSQHFYAGFSPIAKEVIYVDTPGVLTSDITVLPFENISRPMWPFDKTLI